MKLRLNGAEREVPDDLTVATLVTWLELVPEQVAVERNGTIVRRAGHAATPLTEGDVLEVVTLVGGG